MSNHIDDLLILGFSFTEQQLKDLLDAINVALDTLEHSPVDPNMALRDRLLAIKSRIEYMIERKQAFKLSDIK